MTIGMSIIITAVMNESYAIKEPLKLMGGTVVRLASFGPKLLRLASDGGWLSPPSQLANTKGKITTRHT